ncbi:MAG TPA: ABC transporter permease subunit [Spirochaetia bacterium]|nr:ABC transporter permease subunit [Spirochaetia bacterium]
MRQRKFWSWLWLALAFTYFLMPLVATFLFSLRGKKGVLSFLAYRRVFDDPQFLSTFGFSLEMAILTVAAGFLLMVPTTIWIELKAPKLRPLIEALSYLPFVIPPIVLVFGLIRMYSRPPFALVSTPALLVAGYIVISFPYMYRSISAGLQVIHLKILMEAAQSLGASWTSAVLRIVLPNIRSALLSAALLTFAIVIGELTLAVMLAWPAFGPYMALVGRDRAYEPAALAILSFLLTWLSVAVMHAVTRGGERSDSGAGAVH